MPSSASVDAVSFLVCSGLPLHVYSLAFVVALLGLFPLRFGRLVLPANSAVCFSAEVSCPAFWGWRLGWASTFVASGGVCFCLCRFCLQAGFGRSGFSVWVGFACCLFLFWHFRSCGFVVCQLSPAFRLLCFGSGRKVRSSLGLVFAALPGKSSYFGLWLFGFGSARWPNKSVKGTRRHLAVLKFSFLSRFGGFVSLSLAARPLP